MNLHTAVNMAERVQHFLAWRDDSDEDYDSDASIEVGG